jgi:hypothetical protein
VLKFLLRRKKELRHPTRPNKAYREEHNYFNRTTAKPENKDNYNVILSEIFPWDHKTWYLKVLIKNTIL